VNLAAYVDEDYYEAIEDWPLQGWNSKHSQAEFSIIIRSWPEGSYNKSLENTFQTEGKKLYNSTNSFEIPESDREEMERVNTTTIKYLKVDLGTLISESESYKDESWVFVLNTAFDNSDFNVSKIEEIQVKLKKEVEKKQKQIEEFDFAALGLDGTLDNSVTTLKNLGSVLSPDSFAKKKELVKETAKPESTSTTTIAKSEPTTTIKNETTKSETSSPKIDNIRKRGVGVLPSNVKEESETPEIQSANESANESATSSPEAKTYTKKRENKKKVEIKQSDFSVEDQLRIELGKAKNRIRELEEESSLLNKTLDSKIDFKFHTTFRICDFLWENITR
jgi:hypothetical protein